MSSLEGAIAGRPHGFDGRWPNISRGIVVRAYIKSALDLSSRHDDWELVGAGIRATPGAAGWNGGRRPSRCRSGSSAVLKTRPASYPPPKRWGVGRGS